MLFRTCWLCFTLNGGLENIRARSTSAPDLPLSSMSYAVLEEFQVVLSIAVIIISDRLRSQKLYLLFGKSERAPNCLDLSNHLCHVLVGSEIGCLQLLNLSPV